MEKLMSITAEQRRKLALILYTLLLLAIIAPLSLAQEPQYPWQKALETQLNQISGAQDVVVVHLGIRDRDEEAYHVAEIFSEALGHPVIALPSYSGDPTQDLHRAVTQYFDSHTYPVHFEKAWEQIVSRGHSIVGTVFHSGAGIPANTERGNLISFIDPHPGKVTGNMVFVTTDLKGLTKKDFAQVGIQCVQVGTEDLVSWATKPAARYIPFGEYLGPPATALGWALKGPAAIGKDLSKHALLSRQDEVIKALQEAPSAEPVPSEAGGIDLSTLELRYLSEYQEEPLYVLGAALRGSPAEPGQGIDLERASELSWNSLFVWLALPDHTFWVNLNPVEPNRIVDRELGKTDIGRILLEADLQMKKDIGGLIHPQNSALGRQFWDKLWDRVLSKVSATGQTQIAIPITFRVWIVPGEVTVWASEESIYIVDAYMDVKLESEYLVGIDKTYLSPPGTQVMGDPEIQKYAEGLLKEMILPALVREVNTGPQYRELQQVFYSRVLAEWYKKKHRSPRRAFGNIVGQGNVDPWQSRKEWSAQKIFERYIQSLQNKEFDITEETETVEGQYIIRTLRQYVFGGVDFAKIPMTEISYEELLARNPGLNERLFDALLTPTGQWGDERWIGGLYVAGVPEIQPAEVVWSEVPSELLAIPEEEAKIKKLTELIRTPWNASLPEDEQFVLSPQVVGNRVFFSVWGKEGPKLKPKYIEVTEDQMLTSKDRVRNILSFLPFITKVDIFVALRENPQRLQKILASEDALPDKGVLLVADGAVEDIKYQEVFPRMRIVRSPDLELDRILTNIRALTDTRINRENTVIINGVPHDPNELGALGIEQKWEVWDGVKEKWDNVISKHGFTQLGGTAEDVREALTTVPNVLVIVAHADGQTIFFPDGSKLSVKNLDEIEDEIRRNQPTVIVIGCEVAKVEEDFVSFGRKLIEVGAKGVVAPPYEIEAESTLLDKLLKYSEEDSILDALYRATEEMKIKGFENLVMRDVENELISG